MVVFSVGLWGDGLGVAGAGSAFGLSCFLDLRNMSRVGKLVVSIGMLLLF